MDLIPARTPKEFFKEHVEAACKHQRIQPQPLTSYYVVELLTRFSSVNAVTETAHSDEAICIQLVRALESGGINQRTGLKQVGDTSLFICGFFSDSLKRCLVDVDYYVGIGSCAYRILGNGHDMLSPVFAELAEQFTSLVDVLSEVSERTSLTSDSDLLRLYEKWIMTGSKHNGELLVERGITPNPSLRKLRVQ